MEYENEDYRKALHLFTPPALRQRILAFADSNRYQKDTVKFSVRATAGANYLLETLGEALGIDDVLEEHAAAAKATFDPPAVADTTLREVDIAIAYNDHLLPHLLEGFRQESFDISANLKKCTPEHHFQVDIYIALDRAQAKILADALRQYEMQLRQDIRSMAPELREEEKENLAQVFSYFAEVIQQPDFTSDEIPSTKMAMGEFLDATLEMLFDERGLLGVRERKAMVDDTALQQHLSGHVSEPTRTKLKTIAMDWVDMFLESSEAQAEQANPSYFQQVEILFQSELARTIAEANRAR